MTILHGHNVSM